MPDTSAARSRSARICTDIAGLTLFHPDGLRHRADALTAWYGVPFAHQAEAVAGQPAVVGTGSNGGYDVRLTTGGLTGLETTQCGLVWNHPLQVRRRGAEAIWQNPADGASVHSRHLGYASPAYRGMQPFR